ncbi:MAG TPA: 5-deoxy-glucuronate isomerase [bacterium]
MTMRQEQESRIRSVVVPGRQADLIGLEMAEIPSGARLEIRPDGELVAVVFSGVVDVTADGEHLGRAGGRRNVFEGAGHAIYAPPGVALLLTAVDGPVEVALTTAPVSEPSTLRPRIVGPEDQEIADRGSGSFARRVRTILGPRSEAGRLLVGETINPPGNWSSYPPHKHDMQRPPVENHFEEIYLFKVDPPAGFGVQIRYSETGEECVLVRDGDVSVIKSGYHPVAAAPGYSLYYLWVMAGEGRQPIAYFDPAHTWVERRS